jgi:hypothetical protein
MPRCLRDQLVQLGIGLRHRQQIAGGVQGDHLLGDPPQLGDRWPLMISSLSVR